MPDLLVNLLKLPPLESYVHELQSSGILIRCAQPFELSAVRQFIQQNFSVAWADEVSVGFANKPVSVHIATHDRRAWLALPLMSALAEDSSDPLPLSLKCKARAWGERCCSRRCGDSENWVMFTV